MLYEPELTIILTGDTNAGKTTTVNNLVKNWIKIDCNFYAESGQNKTKVTTIFHFGSDNYKLKYNNIELTYETFNDLQKEYNEASKNGTINFDTIYFCHVYIKGGDKINIIDTIGKSDLVTSSNHNSMMELIKENFPNNIIVSLVRTPTREMIFSNDIFYIVMFADLIDYDADKTIEDTHYNFEEHFEKNLFFYSNNQSEKIKKIKDKEIIFYGSDTIINLFDKMLKLSTKPTILTTKNIAYLENDDIIKRARSIEIVLNELKKYNNKYLYNKANKYISDNHFLTQEQMVRTFENAVRDRENHRIPNFGLTRLTQVMRSNFERGCFNSEFFDKMINECDKYIADNSHKTSNKNFKKFDLQRRYDIEQLSKSFTDRLIQHIMLSNKKRKFEE